MKLIKFGRIYFNLEDKIIGRIPTKSNYSLSKSGSPDNSLYFSSSDKSNDWNKIMELITGYEIVLNDNNRKLFENISFKYKNNNCKVNFLLNDYFQIQINFKISKLSREFSDSDIKNNILFIDFKNKEIFFKKTNEIEIIQEYSTSNINFEEIREKDNDDIENIIEQTNEPEDVEIINDHYSSTEFKGYNKIYYGVPGCGKSHYVNETYNKKGENIIERIIFHTEYTYHDFIGFISPKTVDKKIEYKFSPGPFTRILKKALENKDKQHVLIIEEINRGNTSGIFGDIFQLLDRNEEGSSEYFINNETISNYLFNIDSKEIRIPDNLSIIATANTSDQNTNVMDTAFLRRWEMKEVVIEYKLPSGDDNFKMREYRDVLKADNWLHFVENINTFLEENEEEAMASDKLMGQWFVKMKVFDIDKFLDKVIRYLYQDVLKYNRYLLFNSEIKTFSQLKKLIKSKEQKNIFSENYISNVMNIDEKRKNKQLTKDK